MQLFRGEGRGALFDEAYELFNEPAPDSALRYVGDIDETDVFVVGAATKGLQAPGIRLGWAIASKRHIELFRNLSSIAMGGVSRLSQLYALRLLEPDRVRQARAAVPAFFNRQRARYAEGFARLGLTLHTGQGGFYHWAKLPGSLTAAELNERLFAHGAAILPGHLCDMARQPGATEPPRPLHPLLVRSPARPTPTTGTSRSSPPACSRDGGSRHEEPSTTMTWTHVLNRGSLWAPSTPSPVAPGTNSPAMLIRLVCSRPTVAPRAFPTPALQLQPH